jgi:anti-sigma factor RsiW
MDHPQIKLKLFEYLDGLIGAADKQLVEAHLQGCTDCRNQLENWGQISTTLLQPLRADNSELFVQKVMRQVRAYVLKDDAVQWHHFLRWAFPILALSVSGFVLTLAYTLRPVKLSPAALLIGESTSGTSIESLVNASTDDHLMDSALTEQ